MNVLARSTSSRSPFKRRLACAPLRARMASGFAGESKNSRAFCMELVNRGDRPAYLSGLLMPEKARRAFFAIRAMNVELSKIPELVGQNEMTARIRFQWWRDLVDYSFTGNDTISHTSAHPIAKEIRQAVLDHDLSQRWFERVIDSKEADMEPHSLDTLEGFDKYCEQSFSSLFYLNLELLGVRDTNADHAASHLGRTVGVATALNSIPFFHAQGVSRLPTDLMRKHELRKRAFIKIGDLRMNPSSSDKKVSENGAAKDCKEQTPKSENEKLTLCKAGEATGKTIDVPEVEIEKASVALVDTVFEFATHGHLHLEHARQLQDKIPKEAFPAFLPCTWSALFLDRLEKTSEFDIFDPNLRSDVFSQIRLQFHLTSNRFRNRF